MSFLSENVGRHEWPAAALELGDDFIASANLFSVVRQPVSAPVLYCCNHEGPYTSGRSTTEFRLSMRAVATIGTELVQ